MEPEKKKKKQIQVLRTFYKCLNSSAFFEYLSHEKEEEGCWDSSGGFKVSS